MNELKQYILATSLLTTALFCSLLISYWLNQNSTQQESTAKAVQTSIEIQQPKLNKLQKSMQILLPTIRLK